MKTTILGVDTGYCTMGFAIVDVLDNKQLNLVHCQSLFTKEKGFSDKLLEIYNFFVEYVATYKPSIFVYEDPIMQGSTGTKIHEVIGILRLVAKQNGISEVSYKPTEIKLATTLSGKSEKEDMMKAMELLFPERIYCRKLETHACDATSAAVTYFYKNLKTL